MLVFRTVGAWETRAKGVSETSSDANEVVFGRADAWPRCPTVMVGDGRRWSAVVGGGRAARNLPVRPTDPSVRPSVRPSVGSVGEFAINKTGGVLSILVQCLA